jgi:signal peptidase I
MRQPSATPDDRGPGAGTADGPDGPQPDSGYPVQVDPQIPPSPPIAATTRARPKALDAVIEIATTVALAVILYLVIQTFVVQTYRVEQVSMVPTLREDQHLLIDKLTPRFDDYSRGDIIVFHPPGQPTDTTPYIKRVIGVGGDHIELRDGHVFVNGAQLDEPYIARDSDTDPITDEDTWDVPQGMLFVMGDHRGQSVDSRQFPTTFVPVDSVIGRAWLRFWPIDSFTLLQTPTYPNVPAAPAD